MRLETQAWLKIAREDLAAAELLLQKGIYRMVCLHCQQAVEKISKALLTEWEVEFKRTHNIVDLLSLLRAQGLALSVNHEEAGFLNAVYRSRYPAEAGLLPYGEPTADDAGKALALTRRVVAQGQTLLEQRGSRT
jgi:HEPN domain-containing protein